MSVRPVTFASVEPRSTAVIAQTTTWQEFPTVWRTLLDEVYGFVRQHSDLATGERDERWQNVMLYKDDRPAVEIGVLSRGGFEPEGRVIASQLPGEVVATATHRGDYAQLHVTHGALRDHIAAHGRKPAGPKWEIYGHWREDPSQLETDVFWLLAD